VTVNFVSGVGGSLLLQVFSGGLLVDLDSTPTIEIINLNNGVVVVGPTTTGVTHPATGTYLYPWSAPVSGATYLGIWSGTLGGSGHPFQSTEQINVFAPSATTVGPCAWDLDTGCCSEWDTFSPALQAAAANFATMVLWAATGRRFGLCTRTVRPCGRDCEGDGFGGWANGWYWSEGTWLPYIFNGLWRNCWCGCNGGVGCCTCRARCQVYIPGPVNSIISVDVDGTTVDPATYRVDNGQWLVRTTTPGVDDQCWPFWQDYDLNPGVEHTFVVNYLQGIPPPAALKRAAGELACEYAKACLGQPCRLPTNATSIARQGVTISMTDVGALLEKGLTGVVTVDQVIVALNPFALKAPMRIASPDLTVERFTTWP
jgi:hypothetical protein